MSRLGLPRRFDGNYRSSPAICALNNSLRQGEQRETACGGNRDCLTPIQLLSFKRPEEVAPAVEALLTTHHLTRDDVIFVAHIGSDARSYAGALGSAPGNASNSVLGIAQASIVLRSDSSTGSERLRALRVVERTLRGLAAPTDEDEAVLDERWLRDTAVRLALSLNPAGLDAAAYARALRQHVASIPWPIGISPPAALGTQLRAPTQPVWLGLHRPTTAAFAAGTIHSVKGREYPGVVVVLPKNLITDSNGRHMLDHWERRTSSELRRILYVGASRAERLLVLAVHADHVEAVARLLKDRDVPYESV